MKAELLERLTPGQVERLLFAYREICDIYEEACDGIAGAQSYREYFVACDNRRAAWARLEVLKAQYHGDERRC